MVKRPAELSSKLLYTVCPTPHLPLQTEHYYPLQHSEDMSIVLSVSRRGDEGPTPTTPIHTYTEGQIHQTSQGLWYFVALVHTCQIPEFAVNHVLMQRCHFEN